MNPSALLYLLPLVAGGLWPVFGSDPLADRFPMEAKGDIRFQVDAARFLEEGRAVVQVSLSIPESDLGEDGDSASVAISVEPLDTHGHSMGELRTVMTLPPEPRTSPSRNAAAGAPGPLPVSRRWLQLYPPLLDGTAGLRIKVEDLTRYKRGLWDRVQKTHRYGEAAARLEEGEGAAAAPVWMSDLLFVWGPTDQQSPVAPGTGLRAERSRLEPNPSRFYGLYQPILTVYWERYPPSSDSGLAAGTPLTARHRIVRLADSVEVHAVSETLRVDAVPQWSLRRFDLRNLRGGSYRYELTLSASSGSVPVARATGEFQVLWERSNWMLEDYDLLNLGRVLLPAGQFEDFSALSRGGMETYLRSLWNREEPTRPGEANALERKFMQRVRHASENFHGLRPGFLTDRGRVYVRLGPPDEVSTQLNPQDQELLWIALPQEIDEGTDDLETIRRQSRRRTPEDNSAYEIWDYTIYGDPLLPEYINPGQKHGLKYIFVDELGTGDYTLAYTNARGTLQ